MKASELFPQCEFSSDEITWVGSFAEGGVYRPECSGKDTGAYIRGDKGSLMLDGEFTREQLKALVEWMGSKHEDSRP